MWKMIVVAFAAIGACALDEPLPAGQDGLLNASAEVGALDGVGAPDDGLRATEARRALVELSQELAARMDARGVSLAEMQGAVEAGDPERVRELFGFTPAEHAQVNARALAVAAAVMAAVHAGAPESEHPDGLRCDWEILQCSYGPALVAWLNPLYAAGILVGAIVVCTASQCRWEDDSGPRTKQP